MLTVADKKPVAVVQLIRRGLRRYHAYVLYKRTKEDRIRRYEDIHASRETSKSLGAKGLNKSKRNKISNKGNNKKMVKSKKRR